MLIQHWSYFQCCRPPVIPRCANNKWLLCTSTDSNTSYGDGFGERYYHLLVCTSICGNTGYVLDWRCYNYWLSGAYVICLLVLILDERQTWHCVVVKSKIVGLVVVVQCLGRWDLRTSQPDFYLWVPMKEIAHRTKVYMREELVHLVVLLTHEKTQKWFNWQGCALKTMANILKSKRRRLQNVAINSSN
jgi:hypothetical protein